MRARDHTPSLFPDNGRTLTDDVQDAGRRTTPEDSKEGGQSSLCVNGWAVDFAKFFSRRCHVTSCGGGGAYGPPLPPDPPGAVEKGCCGDAGGDSGDQRKATVCDRPPSPLFG